LVVQPATQYSATKVATTVARIERWKAVLRRMEKRGSIGLDTGFA